MTPTPHPKPRSKAKGRYAIPKRYWLADRGVGIVLFTSRRKANGYGWEHSDLTRVFVTITKAPARKPKGKS